MLIWSEEELMHMTMTLILPLFGGGAEVGNIVKTSTFIMSHG